MGSEQSHPRGSTMGISDMEAIETNQNELKVNLTSNSETRK
jgi:hypothetical protein